MKEAHQQPSADEPRALTEVEVEAVSGARNWEVDLGPLGIFQSSGGHFSYLLVSPCGKTVVKFD